jgi:glycosidase
VQSVRVHPLLAYETALNDDKADGYDITDFDTVDKELGTNADFKTLVEDIHDNDMFVIMDLPLTVTSNKHPWFNVSRNRAQPYSEYYIWRNSQPNPDYWQKLGDKFYMVHKERKHPILNWKHEPVRNEMAKIMKKWIERGVNGFFLPYVDYMSRDDDGKVNWPTIYGYLADLREVDNNTNILLYTDAPDASHDAKLPLVTDGKLNYVINNDLAFKTNDTCYTDREASCLYDKLKEALDHFIKYNETWPMWDIGNANMRRIASRSSGKDNANKGDFELWNMLLLMLPGSLNTYYGDEIGMTNGNQTGHLQQRTPMQWNEEKNAGFSIADNLPVKVNDNYKEINYKAQYYTAGTPLKSFRRLAKMRQIDDVMMSGMFKVAKKKPENNVFEFSRYIKLIGGGAPVGRVYVAALNFGNTAAKVEFDQTVLPIPVEERKKGHVVTASSKLLESGEYWPRKEIDMTAPLSLGPHEGIVLRFN